MGQARRCTPHTNRHATPTQVTYRFGKERSIKGLSVVVPRLLVPPPAPQNVENKGLFQPVLRSVLRSPERRAPVYEVKWQRKRSGENWPVPNAIRPVSSFMIKQIRLS